MTSFFCTEDSLEHTLPYIQIQFDASRRGTKELEYCRDKNGGAHRHSSSSAEGEEGLCSISDPEYIFMCVTSSLITRRKKEKGKKCKDRLDYQYMHGIHFLMKKNV